MRRLRERQLVTLTRTEGESRGRRCCVLGVGRSAVALYPIDHDPRDARNPAGEHYLGFDFAGGAVALRGMVEAKAPSDLRFEPSDGVQLPRRAATRLIARTAFELVRAGGSDDTAVTTTSIDFSSDGALLEDPGLVEPGEQVSFAFAPDAGDAIRGNAEVVRRAEGRLALAFRPLDEASRRRIVDYVIVAKRAELERDVELALARPAMPGRP
jgi:hypothetical protein